MTLFRTHLYTYVHMPLRISVHVCIEREKNIFQNFSDVRHKRWLLFILYGNTFSFISNVFMNFQKAIACLAFA